MKKFPNPTFSIILGALVLASCSSNKMTASVPSDNLYFMASDATLATEYAVQNNNPDQFQSYSNLEEQQVPQENFSSRNVNPDYIARYQAEPLDTLNDVVYFDEGGVEGAEGNPDINVYNNYVVGNTGSGFNRFGSPMGFMGGFSPFGMGGFYDPFWGPGFGFRPGFNMSLGFGMGFGRSFFGPRFGMGGFGMGMGSFGMGGFYDPFYNPFYGFGGFPGYGLGMGGFGYGGFGNSFYGNPYFGNRPVYVLPGGEFGDRRVVRANRPTRGATLAGANMGSSSSALQPSTARAQARRDVLNTNGTSSRRLVSSPNSRSSARDFSSSQNDYYNSASSRTASTRNVRSAAMDRSSFNTRSAMPSSRPAIRSTNTRNYSGVNRSGFNTRTQNPSYNRSTSPSYNRGTMPGRVGSPSYNRGGTNNRFTPSRSVTPTRSTPTRSTPSYSAPSRSSGGSVGGGSRGGGGASTGSRGGRGN